MAIGSNVDYSTVFFFWKVFPLLKCMDNGADEGERNIQQVFHYQKHPTSIVNAGAFPR